MTDLRAEATSEFEKDFFTLMKAKSKLKLNMTCYVGQAILDLSKHLMYDFWYNQIKSQYGSRGQLLYTDTDSLLMVLQAPIHRYR